MAASVESRAMSISLAVGVGMLVSKWIAFLLTNSSVIFSDAAESVVHIIAVWFAWYAIRVSERPPDEDHPFGHSKISFVSAGVEGGLICIAAIVIIITATTKLIDGVSLERIGVGTTIIGVAGGVNAFLGLYLVRIGRKRRSLVVEANGLHVLTDAWTSAGAVIGLLLASWTEIFWIDPAMAIVFGANIIREGVRLVVQSVHGLMDRTDLQMYETVNGVLQQLCTERGCSFHRLRVRRAGHMAFVDFHLVLADYMPMVDAHTLATYMEEAIRKTLGPETEVLSHLESETRNHSPASSTFRLPDA